ncbi:hypothetical protein [Streptomyces sp. NBC_00847]|uniref:hypothetical protein n=1 Tax=Streptomyces sp. NBC_00847 TaxID=2975850 RepID=UPI00225E6462|nr:hypothetical protein [Streptomyces sp. NBC_00847]MCX4885872.1 hypothetical protein [Streptomyces sp. NBC_00847]
MRRPAQHQLGPVTRTGWAHPYRGLRGTAIFYNDGGGTPPATPPAAPPAAGGEPPAEPPKPGPPASRTFTQAEVEALAAREKAQGKRSAAKEFAEKHGFTSIEDAEKFIEEARKAKEAALSEQEKREQAVAAREAQLEAREKAAIARERNANRRAVLVGLGATGDDLEDAAALLRVADDADDATITDAAARLKERRPELFGAARPADPAGGQLPPAPGGAPAGGPPPRQTPSGKPGDRGREMARIRGHLKDSNAA